MARHPVSLYPCIPVSLYPCIPVNIDVIKIKYRESTVNKKMEGFITLWLSSTATI